MGSPFLPWDILRLICSKYCDPLDSLHMSMTCKRLYAVWNVLDRRWLRVGIIPAYEKNVPWNLLEDGVSKLKYTGDRSLLTYCRECLKVFPWHFGRRKRHQCRKLSQIDDGICLWCYTIHGDWDKCTLAALVCQQCELLFDGNDLTQKWCPDCEEWIHPKQVYKGI